MKGKKFTAASVSAFIAAAAVLSGCASSSSTASGKTGTYHGEAQGFGGIVSIVLKGGFEAAKQFCERTQLFTLAESLGGVESLVNHPAVMTHASVPVERRDRLGISDALVRLSVGVEVAEDLQLDLSIALGKGAGV